MKRGLKRCLSMLVLACVAAWSAGPAMARDDADVRTLAQLSGLSQDQVRMLLHARTPYAESRHAFSRIEAKFVAAIGERQYRDLLAGQPVRFLREVDGRPVAYLVQIAAR